MRGEYPFVLVDFIDVELPVAVALEAFTPLIPLDAADSGIPAAILRYRVRNLTDAPVAVTVVGSLANGAGFDGHDRVGRPCFVGIPHNEFRDDGAMRGLFMSSSLPFNDLRQGTMALVTADSSVTAKPEWVVPSRDGIRDFWEELRKDGRLEGGRTVGTDRQSIAPPEGSPSSDARVGSLAISSTLQPGQERTFEFILAWHFPNRPQGWLGHIIGDDPYGDRIVRNFYATRFVDAWHVGHHVRQNLARLEADSRAFHNSLYGSTLPADVVDALAASIAALRSPTCFRLEDGTFVGWEGTFDQAGSCEGSCTHVWNYAQTAAYLFPELERTMRRVEFRLETRADGRMNFRSNRVFGGPPWQFKPAVDGQLGTIIRLYREWKLSGDNGFLAELWPSAANALEFVLRHWDSDGDFVLDGQQHNTYDIEFYGANSLANSLFYAALRAAAEIADHFDDTDRAERYRHAAKTGSEKMDRLLWNGEYYLQLLGNADAHPYQFGNGCLSDQLFGQLLAHVVGLGHVLPAAHVRQAIASVYRYNFRRRLSAEHLTQRAFALDDEGGLLLCTWPFGDRPSRPFYYCDEVWTGVEYQVAAHLIYEGLVDEGLAIVSAVRARHDGYRRNPWNEVETGHHYVRSMASWALLLALSGYRYDAVADSIEFSPTAGGEPFRCFFSTGAGWGTFAQDHTGARLELTYGKLRLAQISLQPAARRPFDGVLVNDQRVSAQISTDGDSVRLNLERVALTAGDILRVRYAAVGSEVPAP